jgi:hypothetical protein
MPRLSAALPKYRKHRASGQAVVTLGGKDFYLGPHGTKTSRAEYDRLVGEWMARGRHAPADESTDSITVVEIAAAYLKHARHYYRKHGQPTREIGCLEESIKVLRPLYGRSAAVDFGPVALRVVREAMIAKGWTRKYINKQVGRLVRMFKWATAHELVGPHVYQALSTLDGLRAGRSAAPDRPPRVAGRGRDRHGHDGEAGGHRGRHGPNAAADRLPPRRTLPNATPGHRPHRRRLALPSGLAQDGASRSLASDPLGSQGPGDFGAVSAAGSRGLLLFAGRSGGAVSPRKASEAQDADQLRQPARIERRQASPSSAGQPLHG